MKNKGRKARKSTGGSRRGSRVSPVSVDVDSELIAQTEAMEIGERVVGETQRGLVNSTVLAVPQQVDQPGAFGLQTAGTPVPQCEDAVMADGMLDFHGGTSVVLERTLEEDALLSVRSSQDGMEVGGAGDDVDDNDFQEFYIERAELILKYYVALAKSQGKMISLFRRTNAKLPAEAQADDEPRNPANDVENLLMVTSVRENMRSGFQDFYPNQLDEILKHYVDFTNSQKKEYETLIRANAELQTSAPNDEARSDDLSSKSARNFHSLEVFKAMNEKLGKTSRSLDHEDKEKAAKLERRTFMHAYHKLTYELAKNEPDSALSSVPAVKWFIELPPKRPGQGPGWRSDVATLMTHELDKEALARSCQAGEKLEKRWIRDDMRREREKEKKKRQNLKGNSNYQHALSSSQTDGTQAPLSTGSMTAAEGEPKKPVLKNFVLLRPSMVSSLRNRPMF